MITSSINIIIGVHGLYSYQADLSPRQAAARIADWWNDAILDAAGLWPGKYRWVKTRSPRLTVSPS